MRYGQDVYCNIDFLDEVIKKRKEEPYKTIYQILFRLSNIFLDIELSALKVKIVENPIYQNLNNRDNKGLHSKLAWNSRINLEKVSDEVFLITPGYIEDYEQKRIDNGALILSNSQKDFDYLNRLCRLKVFTLIPKSERTGFEPETPESWKDVFEKQKMSPLNSLIITDNFIFNSDFEDRKEYSLFNLLKTLIPRKLDVDFHLTIFFYNSDGLFNQEKAKELINEIKGLHLMEDENKFKISIVSHTKKSITHDRHILSNYFFTYSGVGFSVIDKNGIQQVAKGDSKCVFHSISDLAGNTSVKHEYNITREWLKKIYERKEGAGATAYIVGDQFTNRLLDDTCSVLIV